VACVLYRYIRALGVARRSLGSLHTKVAEVLSNLSMLLLRDDPPDRVAAQKLRDRADMIQSRALGDPGMPPPEAVPDSAQVGADPAVEQGAVATDTPLV
jgi:hypothetical protein